MDSLIRLHQIINLHGFATVCIGVLLFAFIMRMILWLLEMAGVHLSPSNFLVVIVRDLTDPIQAPFKRLLPRVGIIDLSFIASWFAVQILGSLIIQSLPPGW